MLSGVKRQNPSKRALVAILCVKIPLSEGGEDGEPIPRI